MKKNNSQAGAQGGAAIGNFAKQCGATTLLAALIALAVLALFSFVMTQVDLPFAAHQPISMAAGVLGILLASRWVAMRRQKNGLLLGVAAGFTLFLLLVAAALLFGGHAFTTQLLIKLMALICAGGLGGMLGISATGNRRKKPKT